MIDHPTDLFEAYVLQLLTPELAAQVRDHVATCASCQAQLRATEATLRLSSVPASAIELPPGAEERLMARIRALRAAEGRRVTTTHRSPSQPARRRIAVAVAAVLAASILLVVLLHPFWNTTSTTFTPLAQADQQARSLLHSSQPLVYHLVATQVGAPGTVAAMAMDITTRQGVLVVRNLPQSGTGKVYEFWIVHISAGATTAVTTPTGTFTSGADGVGTLRFTVPPTLGEFQNAGISIEPTGGVEQPDTPMLLYVQGQA